MVSSVLPQATWFSKFPFETVLQKAPVHMTHSLGCEALGSILLLPLYLLDEMLGTDFFFPLLLCD